jgi:hypothetical protein
MADLECARKNKGFPRMQHPFSSASHNFHTKMDCWTAGCVPLRSCCGECAGIMGSNEDYPLILGSAQLSWSQVRLKIWSLDMTFVEGSLEVKLPTIWTDEKQSRAEAERRERLEERRVEEKE